MSRVSRLIVNPDTDSAWEIPLANGTFTFGRAEDNSSVITHPSVSSHHCEVTVSDFGVLVKDLGSANGTLVEGQPVEDESALQPGQLLQLGEVRLRLVDSNTVGANIATPVSSQAHCKFHPHNPSRFLCPKCHGNFCEICVNTRSVASTVKYFCRTCAAECLPVIQDTLSADGDNISFASQIIQAFKYPLKGDGLILIALGTVFFLVLDGTRSIAKFGLIYGWVAVGFLSVLGTGYLMAYLRRILNATAQGEEEMPDWPEIEDYSSDIVSPFRQFLVTVLFCFAPTIGLTIYALSSKGESDTAWLGWATTSSIILGSIYFPMAFMGVAMFDSVTALNPLLIIPSIIKVLKEYILTVFMLAFILLLRWLLNSHLKTILPIPLLPTIIFSLIQLYLMIVEMRVLGLLYRNKKDELGWFT
jgi:hypothetical protein